MAVSIPPSQPGTWCGWFPPSNKTVRANWRKSAISPCWGKFIQPDSRLLQNGNEKSQGLLSLQGLRKLTNNANIQRLIAWWHYCNLHGGLKGIIHHTAGNGQLAESMDKYQERNELPESGINKTWNFRPPRIFFLWWNWATCNLSLIYTRFSHLFCTWGQFLTAYMNESTKGPPTVSFCICGEEKGQWEPIKGEVINKSKRVRAMPLAMAVLDKKKLARNQLEKAPNKCGQELSQL